MKVSLNWIKDYLEFEFEIDQLSHELTMAGLEVEGIQTIRPSFTHVVTSKILSIDPHPNADNLQICQVFDGASARQIVCGAKNMKAGDIVPLAKSGGQVGGHAIGAVKLRGVESFGMLCSEKELGIGFDQSGLYIMPENTPVGNPLEQVLALEDVVLELGITPNRGDCLSVRGVAREIAASFGKKCRFKKIHPYHSHTVDMKVAVENMDLCPVYGGAMLSGVKIKQSPFDLRYKLYLLGLRAINNIVDITNYILLDMGQPMHSFDVHKIAGRALHVRSARAGEKIQTLDGITRELQSSHLVIADAEKPLAVAGIMGGEGSGVFEGTSEIFFESACFSPLSVRKTSRQLGLASDSSYRFERGVDPEAIPDSLLLACKMAEEMADAKVLHCRINLDHFKPVRRIIPLRAERCNKVLGLKLKEGEMTSVLKRIEIRKEEKGLYSIPGYRNDLLTEIDLIEEVARVRGYENIFEHNEKVEIRYTQYAPVYELRKKIEDILVRLGLHQVINYSFVQERDILEIPGFIAKPFQSEKIANPLSPDMGVMRNSLIPGLVRNWVSSNNYKIQDLCFFEAGAVFPGKMLPETESLPQEDHAAFLVGGSLEPSFVGTPGRVQDFFDIKGIVEQFLALLNIKAEFSENNSGIFSKGFEIKAGNEVLGIFGELSPSFVRHYDCKEKVYAAEFFVHALSKVRNSKISFTPLCRLPSIQLDFSMIVDLSVTHEKVEQVIRGMNNPLLEGIALFDIYKGNNIPQGKKSMAYSLTYRDREKTLELDKANAFHDQIKMKLKEQLNADFR